MLIKKGLKEKLGEWYEVFEEFLDAEEDEMRKIYMRLVVDNKNDTVVPLSKDLYRAFTECPIHKLCLVIVGMSPYHHKSNGIVNADGLAFSSMHSGVLQPSLNVLYEGINKVFYRDTVSKDNYTPDLTHWANQGVLLLNSTLTTTLGSKDAHINLWHNFVKFVLKKVQNEFGTPILLLGRNAQEYAPFLSNKDLYTGPHPASALYTKGVWDTTCLQALYNDIQLRTGDSDYENIEWFQGIKIIQDAEEESADQGDIQSDTI